MKIERINRAWKVGLVTAAGVLAWIGGLAALMLSGILPGGCAPQPTTKLNLMAGTMESPKDWSAKSIEVDSSAADGSTRHVKISGLDASASSVIAAQAEAMKAQAEAFTAATATMSELVKELAKGAGTAVGTAAGTAVKAAVKGPVP